MGAPQAGDRDARQAREGCGVTTFNWIALGVLVGLCVLVFFVKPR